MAARGYSYILDTIVPSLLKEGVDTATVNVLLEQNPKRLYGQ